MRTIYICEYCETSSRFKKFIENHERVCNSNPKNKTCLSCDYLDFDGNYWICKKDEPAFENKRDGERMDCHISKELRLKKFKKNS